MRDLVLAEQYKDAIITFATQDLAGNINHKIKEQGYKLVIVSSNDVQELIRLVKKYHIDLVVIDHYGIDASDEKALKDAMQVQILAFDDTYEKHYCDILLNHNIYADEVRYKGLIPESCELRCGSEFTLLREEFLMTKKKKSNLTPKKVLIAMGGADSKNRNIEILQCLEKYQSLHADVVTTTANHNLKALKNYVKDRKNVILHINTSEMAQLMSDVDFAILTPSVTVNEALYLDLPIISIKTADNQGEMHSYLMKNNHLALSTFNSTELENNIISLVDSITVRLRNFVDLSVDDKKMVLKWRNNPCVRKWMFSQDEINLSDHMMYIESLAEKKDRVYFLACRGDDNIGVVGLTCIDFMNKTAELGIYANPNLRGVGDLLMKAILDYGFRVLKLKSILSEVFVENKLAIKLYKRCGFKENKMFEVNGQGVLGMELRH